MEAIFGKVWTYYLVGLMDSAFSYIRNSAVRTPDFAEMDILSAGNLGRKIIIQRCKECCPRLDASICRKTGSKIFICEIDVEFFELRVCLSVVDIGIDRAFYIEAGPIPNF